VLRLRIASRGAWLAHALAHFDALLQDHASCERKAAATAMSLVCHYPDRHELVVAMTDLAREELEHFRLVYEEIAARGLPLAPDVKDPYVNRLHREVRRGPERYFLDRLLVAGVVEARGCERLGLIAEALGPGRLGDLYRELTRSEARHHALFVRIAKCYFEPREVDARLEELLDAEARILPELPLRAAIH
jgi:tRNA-(ms[2]io[6]A)-hydroxylase